MSSTNLAHCHTCDAHVHINAISTDLCENTRRALLLRAMSVLVPGYLPARQLGFEALAKSLDGSRPSDEAWHISPGTLEGQLQYAVCNIKYKDPRGSTEARSVGVGVRRAAHGSIIYIV